MRFPSLRRPSPAPPADRPASAPPVDPATARELAETRLALAEAKAEAIQARAEGWYSHMHNIGQTGPAERSLAVGIYTRAMHDDLADPLPGGKTRLALVEAIFKNRTPHTIPRAG